MEKDINVSPEILKLMKENVMLSNTLLQLANQLEEWSKRLSVRDQPVMKELATNIRHEVRETKFFKKENDNG